MGHGKAHSFGIQKMTRPQKEKERKKKVRNQGGVDLAEQMASTLFILPSYLQTREMRSLDQRTMAS